MRLTRLLQPARLLWLLAVLVVFGQIVGAVAMPEMDASGEQAICGVDLPAPGHLPVHHHHDCNACPLCAAAALHATAIAPGPHVPPRKASAVAAPALPPAARAPPGPPFDTPFPTGPPAFA